MSRGTQSRSSTNLSLTCVKHKVLRLEEVPCAFWYGNRARCSSFALATQSTMLLIPFLLFLSATSLGQPAPSSSARRTLVLFDPSWSLDTLHSVVELIEHKHIGNKPSRSSGRTWVQICNLQWPSHSSLSSELTVLILRLIAALLQCNLAFVEAMLEFKLMPYVYFL